MKYTKALQDRKPITKIPDGITREHVTDAIAGITRQLAGPLSNVERVMLVHDRADYRDILALMDKQPAPVKIVPSRPANQSEDQT